MKKQILFLLCFIFTAFQYTEGTFSHTEEPSEVKYEKLVEVKKEEIKQNELDKFLDHLGYHESTNRYTAVNQFGYMGKYQFHKRTLQGLGYQISSDEFLSNPIIQERAMLDLLSHNKKILERYINYWDGKTIYGDTITESGILAAAHLAGPTNVKRYFRDGQDFEDGNGTKLTKYLHTFSGYNIEIESE